MTPGLPNTRREVFIPEEELEEQVILDWADTDDEYEAVGWTDSSAEEDEMEDTSSDDEGTTSPSLHRPPQYSMCVCVCVMQGMKFNILCLICGSS